MFNVLDEQKEIKALRATFATRVRALAKKQRNNGQRKNKTKTEKDELEEPVNALARCCAVCFLRYYSMWNIFHSRTSNVAFSFTKFVPCRIDFVSSSASGTIAHTRWGYSCCMVKRAK